jgi:type II secretory pathway pseudopilin PulG
VRNRRGTTLLEILVMAGIGVMIFGVAWYLFISMTRTSHKLDTRLRALQASQLLQERLRVDLNQFYPVSGYNMAEATPPRLSFYMFKEYSYVPTQRNQRCIVLEPVTYIFDRESHYLQRNSEVLRFSTFEDIQFSVRDPMPGLGGDASSWVTVSGTYVPEELLSTPDRITERDRVQWSACIGLPARCMNEVYSYWLDNPYDQPNR